MSRTQDFSAIIGLTYDAILNPECWEGVLALLCAALDAKAASINVIDPIEGRASLFVEHGTDPAWTALLLSRYASMSPIGAAVLIADLDQPVGAFDFIDEDEYVESRFYKEWCAPQGYYDLLGAVIAKRPREVGAVSATRSIENGKFGAHDREFVGLVAPHVRRAVTISGLLGQRTLERNALAGVIDQLAAAVMLVDRNGRLQRANPAGEAMCADGKVVSVRGGMLGLASASANKLLHRALQTVTKVPEMIPVALGAGQNYIVAVLEAEPKTGLFALIINRQDAEIPAMGKHLAQLFSLTPREVAVLMPMMEGKTIDEAAVLLGISEGTARTHLKRLMTKTGTNRQAELIQAVMKVVPPLRMS